MNTLEIAIIGAMVAYSIFLFVIAIEYVTDRRARKSEPGKKVKIMERLPDPKPRYVRRKSKLQAHEKQSSQVKEKKSSEEKKDIGAPESWKKGEFE